MDDTTRVAHTQRPTNIIFHLLSGCIGGILGTTLGFHPRDSSRRFQPGGHVYRIWTGGDVSRLDSIPQGTDGGVPNGRGTVANLVS